MYRITEEHIFTEETGAYTSYGIEHTRENLRISDVTMNKEKLICFVNLLNIEKLEPVHLADILEDNLDSLV